MCSDQRPCVKCFSGEGDCADKELSIAGFVLGYMDDGSARLSRDGKELSVRIDHLASALARLHEGALSQ